MKITDVYKFGPDNLAQLGGFIAHCLSTLPPHEAGVLFAAIIANMSGNIPAEHWEAMEKVSKIPCECGDPDCDNNMKLLMEAGAVARRQFEKVLARQGHNPDEKEIQE